MVMAAAKALAALSPARRDRNAPLLPPIADARKTSAVVAKAVAQQAISDGVAGLDRSASLADQIRDYMWEPVYRHYECIDGPC